MTKRFQIGGVGPKQQGVSSDTPTAWYGEAKYALLFTVNETTSVWGVVLPAPDEQENWQQEVNLTEERNKLLDNLPGWPEVLRNAVSNTGRIVKFGLYDRPELPPQQWFHGRCVLVGDAAHPTSPHYGQGANQSLEDCWHLSQLLPDADGDTSTKALNEAFLKYAEKRQPRTAMMVKGARAQGQMRVTFGKEACLKRNEIVKNMWADKEGVKARFSGLFKEPF